MTIDVPTTGRSLPQLQPISFIGPDGQPTDTDTDGLEIPSDRTLAGLRAAGETVREIGEVGGRAGVGYTGTLW